jgi:predicted  nucleic acid-binding Zn-ribbon protein
VGDDRATNDKVREVSSVRQQIALLEKLQQVDLQILESDKKLKKIPEDLHQVKAQMDELYEKIERDRTTLKEAEKWRVEHDKAIEMQQELLAKSKGKLATARNEREANAAQREIDTIRRALSEREEEAIHILEVVEQTGESIAQKEEMYANLQDAFKGMETESRKQVESMEAEVKKLESDRKRIARSIDKPIADMYEKIRQRRPRAVVAAVRGTCGGCHMMLPPQIYNLIQRQDRILTCPSCFRIVYFDESASAGKGGDV